MEQGNGPAFSISEPEMDFIDGFRYSTLEPSATSHDKTLWGLEFEFDKEKGQRTYTDFYFTNTGGFGRPTLLEAGKIPANEIGDNLSVEHGFKDPNYKAKAEVDIFASNVNRNLNLYSTVDDLEHINNINNTNTIIAWKGNYTKDNPNGAKATQGTSSAFGFTVNPWPNENDQLSVIKLNGSHNQKEFVQGQTITTGIKVENLDENARERLVGQVYHPVTGEVVPGAEAKIDKNDMVVVKMPEGVIDENGNINKDSIFYKDSKYKALQNLEIKFFARPRTEKEFRAIGIAANYGEDHYTPTGAGTETINHKGVDVVIDKQGIDRYDHYNEIGRFKINLDDTRYYDQAFKKPNGEDTTKHTSISVKPEEEFIVDLYVPEDKKDKDAFPNQKTPEEMEAAKDGNQAVGSIDWQFINKINEGKKEEDQWKLEYDESTLPTTFKITPPKSAKAGEFVAVPLTYTYTNGSTDVHWFHFVVQESTNNRPDYFVQVDYPSEEQKSTPKLPEDPDDKKLTPQSYSIPEGTEFKDNKGNEWTVSIDETTGEVTAKPNDPSKFDGGETLTVPVLAHYKDPNEPDKDITEETKAEFVIKERSNLDVRYNAKAGKAGDTLTSDVIINQEDKYNRKPTKFTLDSDTFTDDKGNTWNVSIDENTGTVTATVPDGEGDKIDGALLNVPVKAHYYETDGTEIATKEVEVQFVASGTDGTKTYTEKIPFGYKVEYDQDFYTKYPEATDGYKIVTEGQAGEKKTTLTIKDSQIVDEQEEVTKKPVDAVIKVGQKDLTGTFVTKKTKAIEYETEYIEDETLEPGKTVVDQEGELGEDEITVTHTIENGKIVKSEEGKPVRTKEPVKKIVRVGKKPADPTEGETTKTIEREIPYETKVIYDENLEAGFQKIENEGKPGKEEVTITQKIKDSKPVGDPTETTKTIIEKEDRVVRIGVKPVVKETELGFNTKYKHNPDLKEGEQNTITEGVKGSVKYTTTFNKETGELEVTEERTEPTNQIVEYGTKTDGEFTYESEQAYNVIIRENPNLEAGKHNVVQEGVVGKTETTVKIANSNEVSRDTKTITEKKDMIIEIGTKNVCEIPPVDPENPDKPGDKDPENPDKPGDKDPGTPPRPGEDPKYPPIPVIPNEPGKPNEPGIPGTEEPGKPNEPDAPNEDPFNEPGEDYVSDNEGSESVKGKNIKSSKNDYSNAPKTYDPGIRGYVGATGLAGILLAYLQRKKKEDKED